MQIRRPKAETRRKAETRKPNIDCVNKLLPCWDRLLIRMSDFGFPSGFGLRISDLARQLLRDNGIHGFFAGRRLGTPFTLSRLPLPAVTAFDEEPANVINTIASHVAARECKQEVHPMPVPRAIIVEPRPRPRRK